MSGITNLSHSSNKAVLEAAILLALGLAAILIIHTIQRVSAGSPNQGHSVLLNTNHSSTDSSNADTSSGSTSNSSTTKLNVNGHDIPVPQNGAVSETIPNEGGGTSHVEASNEQSSTSGSGTATNKSNTSIHVNSSSSSSSNQGGN